MKRTSGLNLCLFSILVASCGQPVNDSKDIDTHISYPGKLLALNHPLRIPKAESDEQSEIGTEFLLLNTNASNDYTNSSIQHYKFDALGNPMLQNVFKVQTHATDVVVSDDNKLLALSFDGSKKETIVELYDFSNQTELVPLTKLNLKFFAAGGQQAVKQLNFFRVDGSNDYFLYGVILNTPFENGDGSSIPPRVFVAKIASDLSQADVLFVLSYGVGDPNSLVHKTDSLNEFDKTEMQYMFGSNAPTYDAEHNLLIAFPSGSMNGFNDKSLNKFPPMSLSTLNYFGGHGGANLNCSGEVSCVQPDLRTVSLFAVDMKNFINTQNLNLSVYFVPLAWNTNGIPYGHKTNGIEINDTASTSSTDVKSFSFQSSFWASYLIPDTKSLLFAKNGTNSSSDNGNGNEIFQITDLNALAENIRITTEQMPNYVDKASDFKLLADRQIFDSYHHLAPHNGDVTPPPPARASEENLINPKPLTPYMYSRTEGVNSIVKTPTAVYDFSVVCQADSSLCVPYWGRASYKGIDGKNPGRDSTWLTTHLPDPSYQIGSNATFPDAQFDPTKPTVYGFPSFGTHVCTTFGTKTIYCTNFLTGEFTKLQLTASGFVIK